MRLDLFLKTSRLIKRRAIAREMCDRRHVLVNGHEAKPAKEIKTGDIVTLKFSSRTIDLEIMYTRAAPSQHALHEAPYRVMSETRVPKDKDPWTKDLS